MAVVQTQIALDIAERTVQKVTQLLNILNEIEEEMEHAAEAGLNFNNFDTDFAATTALQHIDGSVLNKLKNNISPDLRTYLETTLSGAKSYLKILYEISR
jgi:uncharacterized protein (DUF849 family)